MLCSAEFALPTESVANKIGWGFEGGRRQIMAGIELVPPFAWFFLEVMKDYLSLVNVENVTPRVMD